MPPKGKAKATRTSKRVAAKQKKETKKKPKRKTSTSTEEDEEEVAAELLVSLKDDKSQGSKKSRKSVGSKGIDSVASPGGRKRSSGRANKGSIDKVAEGEILKVVESNSEFGGGREAVRNRDEGIPKVLRYLYDLGKVDVAGAPGSKHRKACDSRLRYLLTVLPVQEYEEICNQGHQIVPVRVKKIVGHELEIGEITGEYRDDNLSVLTSEGEGSSKTKPITRKAKKASVSTASSTMSSKNGFERNGDLWVQHLYVDIDHLEQCPYPYKIKFADGMQLSDRYDGKDNSGMEYVKGTTFKGWILEIVVDPRDLQDAEPLIDPDDENKVLRPKVPAFPYKAWIRDNKIVAEVPYNNWIERGNDDLLIREVLDSETNPLKVERNSVYMDATDEYRKSIIQTLGREEYQRAKKVVHFHLYSSEDPQRPFELIPSLIKLNDKAKEKHHLRLHMMSYQVQEEDDEEGSKDSNDMTVDKATTQSQTHVRLTYFVADRGFSVKRSGADEFDKAKDTEEDEIAAELASLGIGKKRKKKKTTGTKAPSSSKSKGKKKETKPAPDEEPARNEEPAPPASDPFWNPQSGFSILDFILQKQEDHAFGRGKKRGVAERDEISFAEADAMSSILKYMPPDVQSHIGGLGSADKQADFLNEYLNMLLEKMPKLKQEMVKSQPTNAGKFAKLVEYYRPQDVQKKSRGEPA